MNEVQSRGLPAVFLLVMVASIGPAVVLHGGDMYVSADSTGAAAPYDTTATAASNIVDAVAIAEDGTTIHVAPGTYTMPTEVGPITVTRGVRIVGEGETPESVIVRRTARASNAHKYCALFHLNHPDAFVANLVMQYGSTTQPTGDTTAGSAWIGADGGTISNCVVRGGYASHPYDRTPGILIMGPGLVTHCVITNNACTSGLEPSTWGGSDVAAAVVMKGANSRLENCLIRDNRGATEASSGTGVEKLSAIYARSSASIVNCTIIANQARKCAGVYADDADVTVKNCVFAENIDVGKTTANPNWMGSGTFVACATDDDEPINESCIVGDASAFFVDYAGGNYKPVTGGPLVNRGVNYKGMSPVDLAGNSRLYGVRVDIGCYEGKTMGHFITFR